jgi:uncharacterized protein (DUF2147 family)
MKRIVAVAALMMASTTAFAGETYSFEIGGRTIKIDKPRDCDDVSCISVSIPGVYESGPKRGKRSKIEHDDDYDDDVADKPMGNKPVQDSRKPATAPAAPATTTVLPSSPPANASPSVSAKAEPTPAQSSAPVESRVPDTAPASTPSFAAPAKPAAPMVATAPAATPPLVPATTTTSPVAGPPSPLGVWWTEEKEGKVRIEACGDNICGYSVKKTDENGEKILINMKPTTDNKWKGRIHDPKSGSDYDSTIALNGTDRLKVQGCAFGGMFCGGQVWTRVN